MDFDGTWTPGFEDYFVTRFGPDGQDPDANHYWGIMVNGILTSVGGCQYRLSPGDQTLWTYDAFSMRDWLRLDGPTGIGEPMADVERGPVVGTVQRTFTVGLGQPFVVTAIKNQATGGLGAAGYRVPAPGVQVAPVITAPNGVQTVVEGDPATVATDAAGRAALTWSSPGWKRIKATGVGYVRSNRLDVCVLTAEGAGCDAPPLDTTPREPPPSVVPPPKVTPTGSNLLLIRGVSRAPARFAVGDLQVQRLRFHGDAHPTGMVGLRWETVGGATRAWRIDYRLAGDRKARWRRATAGTSQLSALLDLPTGRAVDLRVRFTAQGGRSVTRTVGTVVVPTDDRVRQVAVRGRYARLNDPMAWRRSLTVLRRGATVRTTLPAGRPAIVVRSDAKRAVIEVRSGKAKPQRLTIGGRADGRSAVIRARKRASRSTVQVRVVSGTVRLDGVAVTP